MNKCPLLKEIDTMNGTADEMLTMISSNIRGICGTCKRAAVDFEGVKITSEYNYRSDAMVNKPDDMVRVVLDIPIRKWKEIKKEIA